MLAHNRSRNQSGMLVVVMALLHYRDPTIAPLLERALGVLSGQAGFLTGWVGRSPDDPAVWVLGSQWSDAGALRHGLGSFDAKVALGPLQAHGTGTDMVLELLMCADSSGVEFADSDRADNADSAGPNGGG